MKKVLTTTLAIIALSGLIAAGTLPAADFDGDSRDDIAIFRPSSGLWAIRDVTRIYFGGSSDDPTAGDYNGDGIADIGIFRGSTGLWSIRDVTRVYFGGSTDEPVTGGACGQRLYDYVVKADDGDDLVAALESTSYKSVFIPDGTYAVSEVINVPDNINHIVGESNSTIIAFAADGDYLSIDGMNCHLEELRFTGGGTASPLRGAVYINKSYATIENCRSVDSLGMGFQYTDAADYISLINCVVRNSASTGFSGSATMLTSRLTNCSAYNCGNTGFAGCRNLSSCVVDGNNHTTNGFMLCYNLSACLAFDAKSNGFSLSSYISAGMVDGNHNTDYGFNACHNLAGCHVESLALGGTEYNACSHYAESLGSDGSCD